MAKQIMKDIDLAMVENSITYIDYLDRLRLIATSIFTWENLDKVCGTGASRFLEQVLYEYGRACFVEDKELGYLVLKVNPSDKYNVYNLPTKVMAWSYEYNKIYDFDEIVYIKNNEIMKPTLDSMKLYAYRLYDVERTIDLNLDAQKTPVLLEGDSKSMLTLKNVYMQYNGNAPVIYGNKEFDLGKRLNVLKTDAPYLVDKLDNHRRELLMNVTQLLGISTPYTSNGGDRLIAQEVENQSKNTEWHLNIWYKTRKEACDMINEKFLSHLPEEEQVHLQINNELVVMLQDVARIGGEEDGELYYHDTNFIK